MPITNKPQNPHNNTSPVLLDQSNFTDPFILAQKMKAKAGLPKEALDQIRIDCEILVKNDWIGFLDMYNMIIPFETNSVNFIESETPDFVIDDDGAVTRSGEKFTIDWTAVDGWEAGEDAFFFRVNDSVSIYDDNGKEEIGVITAIDKVNNTFTAKCRDGADWTVDTSNLTIDVNGSDFDKGSCAPEGLLEQRKTKSKTQKLQIVKDAMQAEGGTRYEFCFEDGEVQWYDDNKVRLHKRLNMKVAKTLLKERESVDGSGAYNAGKYGSLGLFQNLRQNGLVHTGYITDLAHLQTITEYWDSLGFEGKEFIAHIDNVQYRHLESIASQYALSKGIALSVVLGNTPDNFMRFGFSSMEIDGYVIRFTKWGFTTGNSIFGKKRIKDATPKGIIMPTGTVPTKINGVERRVPYIFKAYQDMSKYGKSGMIRTYLDGGFNGQGSCEYSKISLSTTVALIAPCPEAITLIE